MIIHNKGHQQTKGSAIDFEEEDRCLKLIKWTKIDETLVQGYKDSCGQWQGRMIIIYNKGLGVVFNRVKDDVSHGTQITLTNAGLKIITEYSKGRVKSVKTLQPDEWHIKGGQINQDKP